MKTYHRRFSYLMKSLLLILLVVLPACSDNKEFSLEPEHPPQLESSVREGVTVLNDQDLFSLVDVTNISETAGGQKFKFSPIPTKLNTLKPGDVLAIPPTQLAPEGALRKVTRVLIKGNEIEVVTEQATLTDAIRDGTIYVHRTLTPDELATAVYPKHAALAFIDPNVPQRAKKISIKIDKAVIDLGQGKKITLRGMIEIEPEFDLQINIQQGSVKMFKLINHTEYVSNLDIEAAVDWAGRPVESTIAILKFAPFRVMVGQFPVWITPILEVTAGIDGEISTGVASGVIQNSMIEGGTIYQNGKWKAGLAKSKFDFKPGKTVALVKAEIKAFSGPELSFRIYGVLGPYFDVKGYLKLKSDILKGPSWELHTGIEGKVGVQAKILSFQLVDFSERVFIKDKLLDSFNLPVAQNKGPCPDANQVNLFIGARAEVVKTPVNLRSSCEVPKVWGSNIRAELHQGDQMTVVAGPECFSGGSWWWVITDTGVRGCIRELLPNKRLLKKIP